MPELAWWMFPLFFAVAFLYSSVGHGGASGYLALFALLGATTAAIVPVALVLNVAVAGIGFINYWRAGHFSPHLLLPFIIGSVPAAYIGGLIHLPTAAFTAMLGSALLAASLRMLFLKEVKAADANENRQRYWLLRFFIGAVLGLLSGMVGVGGGIFLSPILLFLRWADARKTAAVSSAFIVLNSLGGLAGHVMRDNVTLAPLATLGAVALCGGLLGSFVGARRARPRVLQVLLGIVLLIAGGKLLLPLLLG